MTVKNVAIMSAVGAVVVFVVWFALGALAHGVMGGRMYSSGLHGMMMGSGMMTQGQGGMGPAGMMGGWMQGQGGGMGPGAAYGGRPMGFMGVPLTGDADKDFAAEMIPHHQLAVDMANKVMAEGKDPEMKKLAQDVVAAQTKEIEFLKAWIAKQAK